MDTPPRESTTTGSNNPPPPPPPPLPVPKSTMKSEPQQDKIFSTQVIANVPPGYQRVWLCCYSGGIFMGHWKIFIESKTTANAGTSIHVHGDVKNGFEHEFQRVDCEPWKSDRRPRYYDLGSIKLSWITPEGKYTAGEMTVDVVPVNKLEHLALQVPAPEGTLRSVTNPAATTRLTQENCQSYIKGLVKALLALPPDDGQPVFLISRPDVLELAPLQ